MIDKCKVFTPKEIVKSMLDTVNYKKNLFGKKVLENSCGDGNFLVQIVDRYIIDCKKQELDIEEVRRGLERDIVGVELDPNHVKKCKKNLDEVAKEHEIENVNWNIIQGDKLKFSFLDKFDYVIGNPPYINYTELPISERKYIKERFFSCRKGKPDYYYAFTEDALNSLNDSGKMIYLIPNNFFKNRFGDSLRSLVFPNLKSIINYSGANLFEKRMTSSTVILVDKESNENYFNYTDMELKNSLRIMKQGFHFEDKWVFEEFFEDRLGFRFGDLFKVAHGVATLRNNIFVINPVGEDENNWYLSNDIVIEKSITRKAIKPAYIGNDEKIEYIIYPYRQVNNELLPICESELQEEYPNTYSYLLDNREELLKRKSDSSVSWFCYGRSQALAHLDQDKIIMGLIISDRVRMDIYEREAIPYSGVYITPLRPEIYDLQFAVDELNSEKFYDYVKKIGISSNGTSYRITSEDINNYII